MNTFDAGSSSLPGHNCNRASHQRRVGRPNANHQQRASRTTRSPRFGVALLLASVMLGGVSVAICPTRAFAQYQRLTAETPISFDSRGRVTIITPRTVASIVQNAPWWPLLPDTWREARLYSLSDSARVGGDGGPVAVLVSVAANGLVVRYGVSAKDFDQLRTLFDGGAGGVPNTRGAASGVELSQPAGYTFVRNQTFLGLVAYGPATSAILSDHGASAAGGYLVAAGSSFFIAARMIQTRVVTRSQTILGTHGGLRGGGAGAVVAFLSEAHDGPGYGAPILVGAVGGTVGGFLAARNMSDGEAASSGLGADMMALTTIGVAGAADALKTVSKRKGALGATLGMTAAGYLVGPRYARKSHYNVTAGDASVALTGAVVGAFAGFSLADGEHHGQVAAALATAGLLSGFALTDRALVRTADRTSADAGWVKLGAVAGALIGAGISVAAEGGTQATMGLAAAGGALGLIGADRMIAPSKDAGPMRGVLRTSALDTHDRVQLSLPSAITALALWKRSKQRDGAGARTAQSGGAITNFPALRVTF